MKNISFTKFLIDLNFLDKKAIQMRNFFDTQDLNSTRVIDILVEFNDNLSEYELLSLNEFESKIIRYIGMSNSGMNYREYKENLSLLIYELDNIINEFLNLFKINLYFYGEDKFGFIEEEFLNFKNININSEDKLKNLLIETKDLNKENEFNILISDNSILINNEFFDCVYDYEKCVNLFEEISKKLYLKDYDFNYVNNSLKRSYENDVDSIIVGNSYALVGIEEQLFENKTINLSMHSQDLYYAYKLAKQAISNNESISKCIIGLSYYALWHDLSRCESQYSRNMIENIYYPILKDKHNYIDEIIYKRVGLKHFEIDVLLKHIFKLDRIEEVLKYKIYEENNTYYNKINNLDRNQSLEGFDLQYREELGLYRADQHNKMFKYKETAIEYLDILREFLDFLKSKNINPIIVVFPNSEYYFKNFNFKYKCDFDDLINNISDEFNIKILDLRNSSFDFGNEDFIDADHLNQHGAEKATKYLKDFI